MSQHPPAPRAPATHAESPPASRPPGGTPRRAFLLGGLAGAVIGGSTGAAVGRSLVPPPPPPPPAPPPPDPVIIEKQLLPGTKLSYAQFGEDLIAKSLFDAFDIEKPTYMDIGAYEPIISNNTYLLYTLGARGLLVEPNVDLTAALKAERPGDKLLVAGIGIDDTPELDYYVIKGRPQENTFDKEQAERLVRDKGYKIDRVVKLPMVNVNRAIAEHFGKEGPDFLSIDVEGLEFAILKTLDLKRFRPKVICVDTLITGTLKHNPASTEYLTARGYEVRGMSHANTFYLDKALLKDKK